MQMNGPDVQEKSRPHRRPRPLTRGVRRAAPALLAVAAAVGIAACGSSSSGSSGGSASNGSGTTKGMTSITIGNGIQNSELLPLWVAQSKGYFTQQHLKVKFANLTDTTVMPALVSGSAQYVQANVSLFLSSLSQHLPVLATQNAVEGVPVALIVTKKFAAEKGITTSTPLATVIKDLSGSTAGFSSPVTKGQANLLLSSYGVSASSVKEATFSAVDAVETAFDKGQIDWFVTGQPTPDQLQAQGHGIVVASRQNAPAWSDKTLINQVMAVKPAYASAHKTTTKEVMAALIKAEKYINANPTGAAAILKANQPGISTAIAKDAIKANVWPVPGTFSADQWKRSITFAEKAGEVPSGTSISSSNYTNEYLGG